MPENWWGGGEETPLWASRRHHEPEAGTLEQRECLLLARDAQMLQVRCGYAGARGGRAQWVPATYVTSPRPAQQSPCWLSPTGVERLAARPGTVPEAEGRSLPSL